MVFRFVEVFSSVGPLSGSLSESVADLSELVMSMVSRFACCLAATRNGMLTVSQHRRAAIKRAEILYLGGEWCLLAMC